MSAKLPFKCTGSLSPKEHTGRLVPRTRGEEETSSLPPSLHHGAGWPGSHPEQAGSLRARPTLSGEAGNNHPGPHRPLSLGHKPALTGPSLMLTCVQLLGGQGPAPPRGTLAGGIQPDGSMTLGRKDPGQHCPSLLRDGQVSLAKLSGTKYLNIHQRRKQKNIQIIKTGTTPLYKNGKCLVGNSKRHNLNTQQCRIAHLHYYGVHLQWSTTQQQKRTNQLFLPSSRMISKIHHPSAATAQTCASMPRLVIKDT